MMPHLSHQEHRLASRLLGVLCLLLFFYLAITTVVAKTPTNDEPVHLLRGFALSQAGDLRFQFEHPPLTHRLIGSLLFSEEELPQVRQLPLWETGDRLQIAAQLLWNSGLDLDRTLFLARLPVVWLGVLLGSLIGSWALSWHGNRAMAISLILFASSPNLIATSALATTDLATAATYFATVYAWYRYWQRRQKKWWLLAALFLGLALSTKLTAVLLLPVLFLLALLYTGRGRDLWRPLLVWLGLLPLALLVLWVVYGLEVGKFADFPITLPVPTYLKSWQAVLTHVGTGHQAYFWGDLSAKGWWTYFPVAFLIKTPLVTLLLLLIAFGVVIRRRDLWRTTLFLLVPVGALFAAAIVSNLNIGYRHILPALPFLLVFASTAVIFLRRWRMTRILLWLGLGWVIFSALRQNPHHLAYFNEVAGGTSQGYRYLGDSNLDWGQDLKLLVKTMAEEGGEWRVSYSGASDPAYYGLSVETLIDVEEAGKTFAAANPQPGQYAISANHLHGLIADADLFDWFRRQSPSYNLGGSILIYEIEEQAQGQWVAQCLDPTPLLNAEEAESLLGSTGLRHLTFDCRQSFVLAGDGAPGWFILPQADSYWFRELFSPAGERLQLVYRHDAADGTSSYDVYYWPGMDGSSLVEGWKNSAETEEGVSLSLPHALNQTAQLAGYQVRYDQWFTLWSVTSAVAEPLSIQAHLYTTADGSPHVGDNLGFSSEQWQAGDWLVQRHEFPGQEDGLFLETGLYNYQTLELLGDTLHLPAN